MMGYLRKKKMSKIWKLKSAHVNRRTYKIFIEPHILITLTLIKLFYFTSHGNTGESISRQEFIILYRQTPWRMNETTFLEVLKFPSSKKLLDAAYIYSWLLNVYLFKHWVKWNAKSWKKYLHKASLLYTPKQTCEER